MSITSARDGRTTLTQAAVEQLRSAIDSGLYEPGSQLPTEAELVAMLNVSRTVVREALRALEESGLVSRRHGVGTFVRKYTILKNLNLNFGITEMIESAGKKAGTREFNVLRQTADEVVAKQLQVPVGAPVITLERVRTADGRPVVYSLDTFSAAGDRAVPFEAERLERESLYQILQIELGKGIDYGIAQIHPALASAQVASKLELPTNALLLYLVQTDYSSSDEPVLYSREYHLPDAFDFIIWRKGPTKLRSSTPAQAGD